MLAHDITARLQAQASVQHLAFHDNLTGLPNRVQFLNHANQAMPHARTSGQVGAGILLDLDNFKSINDHWGHRCGDELLKLVTERIRQCLPPQSFFARLGGDEFIIVAGDLGADPATAALAAADLSSRILLELARAFSIDQREHFTSASLGIALFGNTEMTVDELLSRADSAMYSAKADGRNTARFFDGKLQAQLTAQTGLERDLRQSLANEELYLVYQPQVDQEGQVVGALEACGANAALLKLELTESLLAKDLDGIVQKMGALKARGVKFSLDDFGTGYSSLAYLKKLPLEQRAFLLANGCHFYQGYLFSRPLLPQDFEAFCAARALEAAAALAP